MPLSGVTQAAIQAINQLIAVSQKTNELYEGLQEALSEIRAAEALVHLEAQIASQREREQPKPASLPQQLPQLDPRE